tara:strand:- start:60 stop:164 length:105 start_codon:yes stop_codon:yes gene_type:complete
MRQKLSQALTEHMNVESDDEDDEIVNIIEVDLAN